MTDHRRLTAARIVHTVIYLIMASAAFALLCVGVTGSQGAWLPWVIAMVTIEAVVFTANGLKCPLTAITVKYGTDQEDVADTFLSERMTRYTFCFFGPLIVITFGLLAIRAWASPAA